MRDDLAQQHTQSEQATKFGLNTSEANAMATVAQINRDVRASILMSCHFADFQAGSFTVEKPIPSVITHRIKLSAQRRISRCW
ncbi:hypothetical protein BC497_29400 (plasmid) [Klebsiella variicola]|nr:hypothetical protein BC497_29400 [Klebsiella variicola]